MKKILIRAGMSIFDQIDTKTILQQNLIGSNIGNLIFPYSVMRTIMNEQTEIDTLSTSEQYTDQQIDYINETYKYIVMPYANAFRPTYIEELKRTTEMIKKITIPCIITGIGAQTSIDDPITKSYSFDEASYEFVKAFLEKSSKIGIRGEVTAKYLKKLGFREEIDFTVIGCPSMFLYGEELPQLHLPELNPESKVSLNWKINLPSPIHKFMKKNIDLLSDYHYVPQVLDEIRLMYYGLSLPEGKYQTLPPGYPGGALHPFYSENKASAFVNVPEWMEYLRTMDFSFGTRIHGNIISLLSGTPAYIIASDSRVREIAMYHNIPHIHYKELKKSDNLFTLYEKADYKKYHEGHKQRFGHYLDFLNENGVEHIYTKEHSIKNTVFDQRVSKLTLQKPLTPFFATSQEEQAKRIGEISEWYKYRIDKKNEQYRQDVQEYKKKIKQLKLNTISVKNIARKVYNKFR